MSEAEKLARRMNRVLRGCGTLLMLAAAFAVAFLILKVLMH